MRAVRPKISVVVPVYNAERHLDECLDSVLGQTLSDIEVVCVDDGSTDASGARLDRRAAADARIRVVHQANAGSGAARNRALDVACGEAVVFMDPDDYYPAADVLEKMWRALAGSGCEMAGGAMQRVPPENPRARLFNENYRKQKAFPRDGVVTLAEYQNPFRYTCYIYRREFLSRNGIRFPRWRRFQDPPFLARALIAAGRFWAMADRVYCYRLPEPETGIDWTGDGCLRLREFLSGFSELLDVAEAGGCRQMYRAAGNAFAHAHRFDSLDRRHPLWPDAVRVLRRLLARGWLTRADFAHILRSMYGDGWGRGRLPTLIGLLGPKKGAEMWLCWRWRRLRRRV